MIERGPTVFLSAGEVNGEAYGALLISELKERCTRVGVEPCFWVWVGSGGRRCAEGLGQLQRLLDLICVRFDHTFVCLP
jgi:lipid A disaccharide synthetase